MGLRDIPGNPMLLRFKSKEQVMDERDLENLAANIAKVAQEQLMPVGCPSDKQHAIYLAGLAALKKVASPNHAPRAINEVEPKTLAVVTAWKCLEQEDDPLRRATIRASLYAALDRLAGLPSDIVVNGEQGREPTCRRLGQDEQDRLADKLDFAPQPLPLGP